MKLINLISRFHNRPVFRLADLYPDKAHKKHELVQLNHWVQQGELVRIVRGMYTLPAGQRRASLDPQWLANAIYSPSYISLEYALSYYGLIPDAVGTITSVTTRKTAQFSTPMGRYQYRHVKPVDFFGFTTIKTPESNQEYWLASPEKAVIDFIHLCVPRGTSAEPELFLEGYRFQNLVTLNKKKFVELYDRFSIKKTTGKLTAAFLKLLH